MAEKKYVSDHAQLMAEWDWERNSDVNPLQLSLGSNKKVWWKCSKDHEWQATIKNRNNGSGCPYCSGRYAIKGENDLQAVNPTLANEWNYERNNGLTPADITHSSHAKVWWKCSKGHEWQATANDRSKGSDCPYCTGNRVLNGYNDLQTINPILASEWNYEKNEDFKPAHFTAGSNKKVWWKCGKGHEWQATINNRNRGSSCPICNSGQNTSFPEYALIYYLEQCGLEAIHLYKEKGFEIDIYIPQKRVAIEYDGYYWHRNRRTEDIEKNKKCLNEGIKLYRIREGLMPLNDSSIDYIVEKHQKNLSQILKELLSEITRINIDVDLNRDGIAIEHLREHMEKEGSLLNANPMLAKEWNYKKNGSLRPEYFTPSSHKRVWWKCNEDHEWQATINDRIQGSGCPYCAGRKILCGYNDLQTINPTLASEWHYQKNAELTPEDVTPYSNKIVWWECNKGHEWKAVISNRTRGSGCPYCTGTKVLVGYNDLLTVNPRLSAEWDVQKNGELLPTMVSIGSNKKAWWKCPLGHSWQAVVANRVKGDGCPYCSNKRILPGYNDLATTNPSLVHEWHPTKNGDLLPTMVSPGSHKKVWWKCKEGHEWQTAIYHRSAGCGCPQCAKGSGKKKG